MRFLVLLALVLAAPLMAQPVIHEGDRVRLLRPQSGEQWLQGVVRSASDDSAVVDLYQLCGDTTRRTVAKSDLLMRVAGSRQTVPAAVTGAIGAIGIGRVLGAVAAGTGGNRINAQRTVWLSVSLLVPYMAVNGSQSRSTKWVPFAQQDSHTDHLHVTREDERSSQTCFPRTSGQSQRSTPQLQVPLSVRSP
jgi:hypothetical protein